MNIRNLIWISFVLIAALLTSCEEEGCTDPTALNYNIVADKDDNSCKYCTDNVLNVMGQVDGFVIDERFGSEYYQEEVLQVQVIQKERIYPYVDCGQSGCFFDVYAKNIIDKQMVQLQYYITIPNTNGFSYSYSQWMSMSLEAGEDTLITDVLIALAPQQYWPINDWNEIYGGINAAVFID